MKKLLVLALLSAPAHANDVLRQNDNWVDLGPPNHIEVDTTVRPMVTHGYASVMTRHAGELIVFTTNCHGIFTTSRMESSVVSPTSIIKPNSYSSMLEAYACAK